MKQAEPLMLNQGDELASAQFEFNGAWMPDYDASVIGAKNYKELVNTRYNDLGLEAVQGYSKINSTALSSYPIITTGIQLRTDFTQKSYVLVHAFNAGKTEAKIYVNKTSVPDAGDFESTVLLTDSTGNVGRFSEAPDGHIAYCNGEKSYIWAGDEMLAGGFITCTDSSRSDPIDETEAVSNTLSTNAVDYAAVGVTPTRQYWVVFSPRPLKGVKYYLKTANTSASTLSCTYYNGSSFTAVGTPSDGTTSGSVALAQDGTFSFDSTVSTAKPFHFNGLYMYAYQFVLSAGNADIYMVTVDAPFQEWVDIWDGVERQPTQFQFYTGSEYRDFTLEVNEDSYTGYEIGAVLDGMTTSGSIIVMFDERQTAIKWKMAAGLVNTSASVATIKYWNGSAYATVGTVTDTTLGGGTDTLGQTGMMSWQAPAASAEFPIEQFGVYGYSYEITVSATLSGTADDDSDELVVDRITGIPAQYTMRGYKFPATYKNMLLGCGDTAGKQGNRVDYSMPYSVDTFNGELSSMDKSQSLYFGDSDPLSCGTELFNRVGNNIITGWVALKNGSTQLLVGDDPEEFQIHPVSKNLGCPAPFTLTTAEVGYDMAQDVTRNIAAWLSNSGPVVYDLAVISPIKGVDKYFKSDDPDCINWDYIDSSYMWFDHQYKELNLLIPSGANQTTNNLWLCYDLLRKKWFSKDTGDASFPQCAFPVMDENGVKYIYAGLNTGYMVRMEHGTAWDTEGISQVIETGDFFPTGNIWDTTRIREVKILAKSISESHDLQVSHSSDTDEGSGLPGIWADWDDCEFADWDDCAWASAQLNIIKLVDMNNSAVRVLRETNKGDWYGWTHAFRFEFTSSDTVKGFQPVGWGIRYRKERVE